MKKGAIALARFSSEHRVTPLRFLTEPSGGVVSPRGAAASATALREVAPPWRFLAMEGTSALPKTRNVRAASRKRALAGELAARIHPVLAASASVTGGACQASSRPLRLCA